MSPSTARTFDLALALVRRRASGALHVRYGGHHSRILLLEGRVLWVHSDEPALALREAALASGLVADPELQQTVAAAMTDDDVVRAVLDAGLSPDRISALKAQSHRDRLLVALRDGEEARFEEVSASMSGVDAELLHDIDVAAMGRAIAGSRQKAARPVVAAGGIEGVAVQKMLDRYEARDSDNWYDLVGVRPSVSPAGLERAATECIESWSALAELSSEEPETARRATLLVQAAGLVRDRLGEGVDRDAYDQLLRRGGAPKVHDLIAELTAEVQGSAPPSREQPPVTEHPKKGLLARLFGGSGG